MMNVIKTAIITIIISIISGLLVEHFKNLAPRILCNIGNGKPMKMGDKKVYAYIVTVSNLSKKIIHELTLNVQSSQSALKIAGAKITKGLKFDSSIKNNILDIYIPFLSKGDKFSVTVYVENRNKPIIVMRSPENFKRIDSEEQNGVLSSFLNTSKSVNEPMKKSQAMVSDEKDDYTMVMNKPLGASKSVNKKGKEILHGSKALSKNKKAMIAGASLILLIIAGVLVKVYFNGAAAKAQIPAVKTDVSKQPTDTSSGSANNANKNVGRNTGTKTPTSNTTRNTNANTSTGGSTSNTNLKPSSSGTTENKDTKPSTSGTTGNSDTTKSTGGSNENTNTNTSTNQTNGNSGSNTSTNGGNAGTNTSTSGTNQSAGK